MNRKVIKKTFLEAFFVISLSIIIALFAYYIRMNTIDTKGEEKEMKELFENTAREISFAKAKKLIKEKAAVIVDSRSNEDFQQGRIKGAVNLPNEQFDEYIDNFLQQADFETTIITYCNGKECDLAKKLAEKLQFIGFKNLFYIKNGLSRWKEDQLKNSTSK
jgi:rhodanese-related sulfurtransferase